MFFFSFCCITIAKPSSPWHALTACLPIYSIPNEPVTQTRTGPGSLLVWHPSRSLKCQLYSAVEGAAAFHRNSSVGKDLRKPNRRARKIFVYSLIGLITLLKSCFILLTCR